MSARVQSLVALVAGVALAACGNLSNDDLRFLSAVPKASEIELRVAPAPAAPALTGSSASALTAGSDLVGQKSQFYDRAEETAVSVNGGVGKVLDLVGTLGRAARATQRGDGFRVWGPVRNVGRRGLTMRFEIRETKRPDGGPRFVFCLHAGRDAAFTGDAPTSCDVLAQGGLRRVLFGHHDPADSGGGLRSGRGELVVHGDALQALGDAAADPGRLVIDFDFQSGGADKQLHVEHTSPPVAGAPSRTVTYEYSKVGDAVDFYFQFDANVVYVSPQLETVTLDASWKEGGPGRGDGTVAGGDLDPGEDVTTTECWDANHLRTYYRITVPLHPERNQEEGSIDDCPH